MESLRFTKSKIVTFLIILNVLFIGGMTFAFWASAIAGDADQSGSTVTTGHWGTPIFTNQEFFDFATKLDSLETDEYYLANNLDFTSFPWEITAAFHNAVFRGTLNANNKTISNLTIVNNSTTLNHNAIFPRIDGGRIFDLTLDNVHIESNLNSSNLRAALISSTAIGGTVELTNISVNNSSVIGTTHNGVGGLIARVRNAGTVVNIENIKVRNLALFNNRFNVGGLVGRIDNGATVNITDVDFQGTIYSNNIGSNNSTSNAGGLIGAVYANSPANINRAIIDATFQNTVIGTHNYLGYSNRNLGGIIGNQRTLGTVINNAFFTGSLFTRINANRNRVGTISGNDYIATTSTNVFHSNVAYRSSSGTVVYDTTSQLGEMAVVVNAGSMPSVAWWNNFATYFLAAEPLWLQDPVTGRLYLGL